MVQDSRTPARIDQLRPLNQPRPLLVFSIDGRPVAIGDGEQRAKVAAIEDHWCVDDEWWREPIRRRYYQIITDTGANRTLYHDLVTDTWFEQRY